MSSCGEEIWSKNLFSYPKAYRIHGYVRIPRVSRECPPYFFARIISRTLWRYPQCWLHPTRVDNASTTHLTECVNLFWRRKNIPVYITTIFRNMQESDISRNVVNRGWKKEQFDGWHFCHYSYLVHWPQLTTYS